MSVIFGEHEPRTIQQLARCAAAEPGALAVLCADGHVGYSQPIGGAVAYRDHISPSGVGYDIGCGNKATRTDLLAADVPIDRVMDEVVRRISFGVGRVNDEQVDHPVIDRIAQAPFAPQRGLQELAADQLGTVGAGNHYVDLFEDRDDGALWVGVHFGSRGFGHRTASGFLALAEGKQFDERAAEGEMDSPPVLFATDTELGQSYLEAMRLAGDYAYAGRDVVVDKVLEILGARETRSVHNHHNFAWREEHDGDEFWVVRKGCTPAFPGQAGFVGSTMGEDSVILVGEDTPRAQEALRSTVHGAGRVMSRTQAAGKTKRRKLWECSRPGCTYTHTDLRQFDCPDHGPPPDSKPAKRWYLEQVRPGLVDFEQVKADVAASGITLRGGAADEAPAAYKRLDAVLAEHGDTITITNRLRPIGVAMADRDTYDPFKD